VKEGAGLQGSCWKKQPRRGAPQYLDVFSTLSRSNLKSSTYTLYLHAKA
jgi:hypothetical protein